MVIRHGRCLIPDITMDGSEGSEDEHGKLRMENDRLAAENELLRRKVDLLIRKVFGSSSEKLDLDQLLLFDPP